MPSPPRQVDDVEAVRYRAFTDFNTNEFLDNFPLPTLTNAGGCCQSSDVMGVDRDFDTMEVFLFQRALFELREDSVCR